MYEVLKKETAQAVLEERRIKRPDYFANRFLYVEVEGKLVELVKRFPTISGIMDEDNSEIDSAVCFEVFRKYNVDRYKPLTCEELLGTKAPESSQVLCLRNVAENTKIYRAELVRKEDLTEDDILIDANLMARFDETIKEQQEKYEERLKRYWEENGDQLLIKSYWQRYACVW